MRQRARRQTSQYCPAGAKESRRLPLDRSTLRDEEAREATSRSLRYCHNANRQGNDSFLSEWTGNKRFEGACSNVAHERTMPEVWDSVKVGVGKGEKALAKHLLA